MTDHYGTVAGADAYHLERGNVLWAGGDSDDKTSALIRASEWLDGNYYTMFPGLKTSNRSQERQWPRTGAYDVDLNSIAANEIPSEVERATYEAALRELISPGALSVDFTGADVIRKASVDGAVSVEFGGDGTSASAQLEMPTVDAILAPILVGGGQFSGLSGSRVRS